MRAKYLNLRNTNFIFGGLTSPALRVLEGSLRLWDKDTGYPSTIIKHNMRSQEPYTKKGCTAGIVCEHGKGMHFALLPFEVGKSPVLQFIVATNPGEPKRAIEAPMRFAFKGMRDLTIGYMVYTHAIVMKNGDTYVYYGITSRHWLHRLKEHETDAAKGSPLLFHRALREKMKDAAWFYSTLIAAGRTKDEAYDMEEYLVSKYSFCRDHIGGLNLIPGGYEGIRWLGRFGGIIDRTVEPEERDSIVARIATDNPRLGISNPIVAALWEDDAYAEAVICGGENRLSADQVRHIRMLAAEGYAVNRIVDMSGASNVEQVNRVISGRTYSRIR